MTKDQALQKIKKCLALGRSATEHEAAAAMRQARAPDLQATTPPETGLR